MKRHPHNSRESLYRSLDDVPADVLETYHAGRMRIPRTAFAGCTNAWDDLAWINASEMPDEWEVGDIKEEWATGAWVYLGSRDEDGRPLFTFLRREN